MQALDLLINEIEAASAEADATLYDQTVARLRNLSSALARTIDADALHRAAVQADAQLQFAGETASPAA